MMGFFKKSFKAAIKASTATPTKSRSATSGSRTPSRGSTIVFVEEEVIVQFDPDGFPDSIKDSGLTPRVVNGDGKNKIDIVGESHRQGNIRQVQQHYADKWFQFFLVNEPENRFDKNAVAVFVGNAPVGYLAKDEAKVWSKLDNNAKDNGQLIVGEAHCVTNSGAGSASMWGVFGYLWFGNMVAPDLSSVGPKKLTPVALKKSVEKIQEMVDNFDYPETAGASRVLGRKAGKVVLPVYQHALWMAGNLDDETKCAQWNEVVDGCGLVFEECEVDVFNTGEDVDASMDGVLEDLLIGLKTVLELDSGGAV
jgi:hypothetical protein